MLITGLHHSDVFRLVKSKLHRFTLCFIYSEILDLCFNAVKHFDVLVYIAVVCRFKLALLID